MWCGVQKIGEPCAEGLALLVPKAIHPFQNGHMSACLSKHELCPAAAGFRFFIRGVWLDLGRGSLGPGYLPLSVVIVQFPWRGSLDHRFISWNPRRFSVLGADGFVHLTQRDFIVDSELCWLRILWSRDTCVYCVL